MKNLKIALCIAGQPRHLTESLDHIYKNLIEPNNIQDIFTHIWYHEDLVGKKFSSSIPENNTMGCWKKDTDTIILNSLKPKKYIFEKQNEFEEYKDIWSPPTAIQTSVVSNYYGMWRANELKKQYEIENNFKYDIVIRVRFDLFYFEQVLLSKFLDDKKMETHVFVPHKFQNMRQDSWPYSSTKNETYYTLSEMCMIGSSSIIDKCCEIYEHFKELYELIYPHNYGENYAGYYIRHICKLPIEMNNINYDIMYRILPKN